MGEVVLINKNFTKGLSLRGYKVNDFKKLEIFKNIDFSKIKIFDKNNISIGKELSFDLGLNVGDNVLLMSPIGEDTIMVIYQSKKFIKFHIYLRVAYLNLIKMLLL